MRTVIVFSKMLLSALFLLLGCEQQPVISPNEDAAASQLQKGKPPGDPAIVVSFRDAGTDNIFSDGRGSYEDGVCGVSSTFNLNDARLDPDAGNIRPQDATACGGREPRKIKVAFTQLVEGSPPGGQDGNTVASGFMNVDKVELVTVADGTVDRSAIFHEPGCAHGLRFDPNADPLSNFVQVTNNGGGTWTVEAKPPNDVAVCIPDEHDPNPPPRSYYHMPFRLTVQLK